MGGEQANYEWNMNFVAGQFALRIAMALGARRFHRGGWFCLPDSSQRFTKQIGVARWPRQVQCSVSSEAPRSGCRIPTWVHRLDGY